jgi:hypothetical protein
MIDGAEHLTAEDKLYILTHKDYFAFHIRQHANFCQNEWDNDIKESIGEKGIENYVNTIQNLWKITNPSYDDFDSNLKLFISDLHKMETDSKEKIVDMFLAIKDFWNKTRISDRIVFLLMDRFVRDKVKAFEILEKIKRTEIPKDDPNLLEFINYQFEILIDELIMKPDATSDYYAMIIFLMTSYLNATDNGALIFILGEIATMLHYNEDMVNNLSNTVNLLCNNKADSLQILDRLTGMDNSIYTPEIYNNFKTKVLNNYDLNKICDNDGIGNLVVGDNSLPENMTTHELIIELSKLKEDKIRDYIGENKLLSFDMAPNDIGYLKVTENLPVSKVFLDNGKLLTITKKDDISYLLFRLFGDDKLYGLSFPSGFRDSRKCVIFGIPKSRDYQLVI